MTFLLSHLDLNVRESLALILFVYAGFSILLQRARAAFWFLAAGIAVIVFSEICRLLVIQIKPAVVQYISDIPTPVVLFVALLVALMAALLILQRLLTFVYGRRTSAHAVGQLIAGLIVLLLRVVFVWLFKLIAGVVSTLMRRSR